ncbi:hypothetical protein ACFPMF_16125 [Larkinella bovis]|uniref:Uncharacterized protein n=1 Tax=Larkinella bovis TaxID=683041 RepID=A0ABW0IBI7_9BACT
MERRLNGKTIFLSASIPRHVPEKDPKYVKIDSDAAPKIEQAIVSLARTVFFEGGQLVFGGHPTIAPLVALVAAEYSSPTLSAEDSDWKPIIIYQSRVYENELPDETWRLFRLGYAEIRWTEEQNDNELVAGFKHKHANSLTHLRTRLINETKPDAIVCIGGMEGVEHELTLFSTQRINFKKYVLGSTGGAAFIISKNPTPFLSTNDELPITFIDQEIQEKISPVNDPETPKYFKNAYVPFPLIMQELVKDLLR